MLPEAEQTWVTMDSDDWEEVRDKEGHLIYKYKSCVDQFPYNITVDENTGKKKILMFKEKRVLTYNPKLCLLYTSGLLNLLMIQELVTNR